MAASRPPRTADLEQALEALFASESKLGKSHVIVRSGDLHRKLGVYPAPNHAMPICCNAMYAAMIKGDEVIRSPPKGMGANLYIRYRLPR